MQPIQSETNSEFSETTDTFRMKEISNFSNNLDQVSLRKPSEGGGRQFERKLKLRHEIGQIQKRLVAIETK